MKQRIPKLLIVDDEEYNLKIITHILKKANISLETATNGRDALLMLEKDPTMYDAVLLDRIMPELDGLETLKLMKKNPQLVNVPVIFQTSLSEEEEITEGLKAGAFYYLTKPYDKTLMLAIIKAAIQDFSHLKSLVKQVDQIKGSIQLIKSADFHFQTINEAHALAAFLANVFPKSNKLAVGLYELLANAVEHGNLGITYEEKSSFNKQDILKEEIERRLTIPPYNKKIVKVKYVQQKNEHQFIIEDEGQGFDWEQYLDFEPQRLRDSHGRGIAMANSFSFNELNYLGIGNKVVAIVRNIN